MIFGSIDYSMTSPCIGVFAGNTFDFHHCQFFYLTQTEKYVCRHKNILGEKHIPYTSEIERFTNISTWVLSHLIDCDVVVMEDYSLGSKGRVFHIAENTGILKYRMVENHMRYYTVPPTSLKKWATGKGNSNKEKMYESFYSQTKVDLLKEFACKKPMNPICDIVDSYYLLKYCYETYKE